ncbi:MAG TPA: ATP-binding protein [Verrucomicrobiae bacterium]|jgi:PAS domain S-box-containing protein
MPASNTPANGQPAGQGLPVSEEFLRLLVENTSDIITVVNDKGVLRFISPSATPILGYEPEEVLNRNIFDLIDPLDLPRTTAALGRMIADPTAPMTVEYRARHRDGSWRVLQSVARSVPGQAADGFVVVSSRDVTGDRKREEELRQAGKVEAISQLASGVAHDFNNILAAMMMQAELSAKAKNMPLEALDGFQKIRNAAQRGVYLTRELLLFSNKQAIQPRNLNLNEVITNIAKTARQVVGESIKLQLNLHSSALVTQADAGMLDQIVLNLAANARDAMPQGGKLAIATGEKEVQEPFTVLHQAVQPGEYVYFSVSDSGVGIPREALAKIFEPLFTTKEPGKGMGLGLATVMSIVKQHNGFVTVESELDRGTKFTIHLPTSQGDTESIVAAKPRQQTGTETILLVEDDTEMRALAQSALAQNGYKVLEAANGLEALKLWVRHQSSVALLLTDLAMPGGILGHELAMHLQQEYPELKVVFISGYSAEFAGGKSELRLGENFLQKPFSADQLMDIIRRSLDS